MANKVKHDVSHARSRLSNALHDLVQRKDSADEEPIAPLHIDTTVTPPVTPSKRGVEGKSSGRKRRRKEEDFEPENTNHRAYVMKLFDRSIDLAQFSENTNLYPVCRTWIRNDTQAQVPDKNHSTASEFTDKPGDEKDIYKLPDPVCVDESGQCRDLRIPAPMPQIEETLDIHENPDRAAPPEQLLLKHMNRWKKIRNRWLIASRRHESQYERSLSLLKAMYDAQTKEMGAN